MKIAQLSLLIVVTLFGTFACKDAKNGTNTAVDNSEPIEIEFLKEGELTLTNNDSILKKVDIEIAKTANERAIGLMNRSKMEENQGMLFIFEEDNASGFYMKDTRIPLDIIFLGQDSTVISVSKNRKPFDENSEGATSPYRFVLELNGGLADAWGIQEGVTKIDWQEQ